MKGLELARAYYETVGRAALEQALPALAPRMAVGLAGEGSECFGFDDELSRDHDWGPGFCIWLQAEDFDRYGEQVQAVYDRLPGFAGMLRRQAGPNSAGRIGCLCIEDWYARFTGLPQGPQTLAQWRRVPEAFLATATNGQVFCDPLGRFTAIRQHLLGFYPEDIRLKKLAARAAAMAQAGQYNYPRCVQRGEIVAAQLALGEFMRAAMSLGYLLNRHYAPFYKWMHRGLRELPKLPRLYDQMQALCQQGADAQTVIEGVCINAAAELRRQGLSDSASSYLLDHCPQIMEHIQDPALRESHIMEE